MRKRNRIRAICVAAALVLAVAGCSSSGGKKQQEQGANLGSSGKASTPRYTVAMVTHAAPGDTFWDIIQNGARAAASKDNIQIKYSNDQDAGNQANLVQNAIDSKVDALAVTNPNTKALAPEIQKAVKAGIPVVMFNAGFDDWQKTGALMYFGQDEKLAGVSAGKRLSQEGAKKVLCVVQTQGQVQLEDRCAGVKQGFSGTMEKMYVNGTDLTSVTSDIQAKLTQDKSIDHVITLAAPVALAAVQSVQQANSSAKIATFDTNAQLVKAVKQHKVEWAIDQQPFLQGYESIDSLWLYLTNGDVIGGGQPVLTGPAFIDSSNIDQVAKYAQRGTR